MNSLIENSLVMGNADSITLFGSEGQGKLRDASKKMSEIMLNNDTQLDESIADIIEKIEAFQKRRQVKLFKGISNSRILQEYNALLVYIDKMTLGLQLREAQLIKDNKLLDHVLVMLKECEELLANDIEQANSYIVSVDDATKCDTYDAEWASRLKNKENDLKVSHTISIQSQAQIIIMKENNQILIDQIVSTINNTLPMWRNQISMMMSLNKMDNGNKNIQKANTNLLSVLAEIRSLEEYRNDLNNKYTLLMDNKGVTENE